MTEHSFHGIHTSRTNRGKCYPCVRNKLSPMSRNAHSSSRMAVAAKSQHGFALLEVLVAFAIAALALAVLFDGAVQGLSSARAAARYEEAIALARSHLAASGAEPVAGDHDGDDGNGFHYHVHIQNAGSARYASPADDAHAETPPPVAVNLFAITVWVSWNDGGATREVRLDSARLATAR